MTAKAIFFLVGCVFANFAWQAFGPVTPNYSVALDRSFFQVISLFGFLACVGLSG